MAVAILLGAMPDAVGNIRHTDLALERHSLAQMVNAGSVGMYFRGTAADDDVA